MKESEFERDTPAVAQNGSVHAVSSIAPVLLAVDFSEDSQAALIWACNYAEAVDAPLEVLHVVHDPADSPGSYRSDGGDPMEPMADVATRRLSDFVLEVARGNPQLTGLDTAKQLCVDGLPATKIVHVAESQGAQLLVLGSGHRNGLGRLLSGSTAHQVVRHAKIPVTIVNSDG